MNPKKNSKIPIKWSSPEAIKFRKFSKASDIWSLGICFFEILGDGVDPYGGISNHEISQLQMKSTGFNPDLEAVSQNCDSNMKSFLQKMWSYKTEDRPSAMEVAKFLKEKCIHNPEKSNENFIPKMFDMESGGYNENPEED